MQTKWMPWDTSHGPVEIQVEYPADNALPNRLHIRRDKSAFVSVDCDTLQLKYDSINDAIERESGILFRK